MSALFEGCGLNRLMADCQAVAEPPTDLSDGSLRLDADTSCKEVGCRFFDATLDESFLAPLSLAEQLRRPSSEVENRERY